MNKRTREAVRTIGYLLETNGTTKAWARNKYGSGTSSTDPNACQWCLDGAITVVAHDGFKVKYWDLTHAVEEVLGLEEGVSCTIGAWDGSTKAKRKAMIKKLKNA